MIAELLKAHQDKEYSRPFATRTIPWITATSGKPIGKACCYWAGDPLPTLLVVVVAWLATAGPFWWGSGIY